MVCADKYIGKEAIRVTMGKIWRLSKPTSFKEVGKNIFIISFVKEKYKQRVMDGKPWFFDYNLFALQNLDDYN